MPELLRTDFHHLSSGTLVSGRLLSSLPPFGGERGSLKGHETGFHARQSNYILFSNKLFALIATRRNLKNRAFRRITKKVCSDRSRFFCQDHRFSAADQLACASLLYLDHVAADFAPVDLTHFCHLVSPLITKFIAFYFKSFLLPVSILAG